MFHFISFITFSRFHEFPGFIRGQEVWIIGRQINVVYDLVLGYKRYNGSGLGFSIVPPPVLYGGRTWAFCQGWVVLLALEPVLVQLFYHNTVLEEDMNNLPQNAVFPEFLSWVCSQKQPDPCFQCPSSSVTPYIFFLVRRQYEGLIISLQETH